MSWQWSRWSFLVWGNPSFPLSILTSSLCLLPQSLRKKSLIQRLACNSSFWAVIPGKRSEEPGIANRGGKGNTRTCHQAIHCCGQLGLNPPGPFGEHPSCHSEPALQGVRRKASIYQCLPPPDLLLSRVATWGINSLSLPVLCMPEGEWTPGQKAEIGMAAGAWWCQGTPMSRWWLQLKRCEAAHTDGTTMTFL